MKKLTTLLTMTLIALMSLTLTSCDKDADIADTLNGTWKGDMYVEKGNYDAVYSVIRFDKTDGWYSGTGYWIDYYQGYYWGGHNYIANRIDWTVRDGNIYITLRDERTHVVIYDYSLNDRRFSGYIDAQNQNHAYFELSRDSYGYDWDKYYWGYNKYDSGLGLDGIQSRAASDSMKVDNEPARKFVVK